MSISANLGSIEVNGITYVPADSVGISSTPVGNRSVVVIDRGWIFAGNVTTCEVTGELTINRCRRTLRITASGQLNMFVVYHAVVFNLSINDLVIAIDR